MTELSTQLGVSTSSKSKGIIVYLLITFGVAWALWAISLRINAVNSNLLLHLATLPLTGLPGGLAPAIGAIVVRKWITCEGFADAGLQLDLRSKWPYYLLGWLSPFVVALIIAILAIVLGISQPDFSLKQVDLMMGLAVDSSYLVSPYLVLIVFLELVTIALISTPISWGEEFGWRGYLQVRLFSHRPMLAAVTTGLIWGAWHCPFFFLQAYTNSVKQPASSLLVFLISTILLSIIFGWLRYRTGSVWAPSLAHAATNYLGAHLTRLWFAGESNYIWWSYLGVLGWIPLGIFCGWIIFSGQLQPVKDDTIT
jgi:membrane protease YdiL (CAAX protease family)